MTSTEMAPTIKGIVYRIPVERPLSVLNFPIALGSQNNSPRQAQQPKCVGARTLGTGKPVREQDQSGRIDPALRHSQKQPEPQKFVIGTGQAATDRKEGPYNQ